MKGELGEKVRKKIDLNNIMTWSRRENEGRGREPQRRKRQSGRRESREAERKIKLTADERKAGLKRHRSTNGEAN